jgi:hypothetical protein
MVPRLQHMLKKWTTDLALNDSRSPLHFGSQKTKIDIIIVAHEDAKASGLVRRAFDGIGLTAEQVAPAGMKP